MLIKWREFCNFVIVNVSVWIFNLVAEAVAAVLPGLAGIAHPSDVLDMPVDPNEPTYCLCHQVSYGEMIGCDNPDVSTVTCVEYLCIFIEEVPKRNWTGCASGVFVIHRFTLRGHSIPALVIAYSEIFSLMWGIYFCEDLIDFVFYHQNFYYEWYKSTKKLN